MYKLLLCWRYLRTRFLALVCIVSVMLGVATLIVVNSVMSGFSTKLRDKLHELQSDVTVEGYGLEGFSDYKGKIRLICEDPVLKDKIEAVTPTLEVFAMLQYTQYKRLLPHGNVITRPIHLVGIDLPSRLKMGGFKEHLVKQKAGAEPSFELSPADQQRFLDEEMRSFQNDDIERARWKIEHPNEDPLPEPTPREFKVPRGIILGNLIPATKVRLENGTVETRNSIEVGDDVVIITVTGARLEDGGQKLAPVTGRLVVVDFFKSGMSEYDNNFVFMPLEHLQHLRSMEGKASSIQIKLKDYDGTSKEVVARLQELFKYDFLNISTWEDKQGSILAAISIEKGILNVLLFLIIAVAGFGILAIFSMIVTEKTRDIGILKALGASSGGVMSIFLGYGLLLGVVGAGLGSTIGVTLAVYINEIEQWLTRLTGQQVFNRQVYYFDKIPVDIQPMMLVLVNVGAILIAVLFSVLPALRAALLHPVRALRYE